MKRTKPQPDASPDEARAILQELARVTAEQPTFTLPNPRDRAIWEAEQRRRPENQRTLWA